MYFQIPVLVVQFKGKTTCKIRNRISQCDTVVNIDHTVTINIPETETSWSCAFLSGCTVHFCTNEYDKGPIIVQRTCKVENEDTPDTLAARVFEQECIAYPEAIRLFAEGRILVENNATKIKT